MRRLSPVNVWAAGLALLFVVVCGGVFLAHSAGDASWQVTVSRSDPVQTEETVQEERPASLLPGERIDLNTASAEDLTRLPQIGESRAADIVAWREENGPFRTTDELMKVSGIGEGIFARIEGYVTVRDIE